MSPAKHDWARASIVGSVPSPVGGCVAGGTPATVVGATASVVGAATGVVVGVPPWWRGSPAR